MNSRLKIYSLSILALILSCKDQSETSIFINQIGFAPKSIKKAFVSSEIDQNNFLIINMSTNDTVYKGALLQERKWEHSGTSVRVADFTSIERQGSYKIQIGNIYKPFDIKENVNSDIGKSILKSFYFARASEPVLEEFGGLYKREMGHPDDKVKIHFSASSTSRPEGTIVSSPGGWYDAGDYNKYIVNSGITTYSLLHLYQLFPDYWGNKNLNIPESKNSIPDLLDEILINLRWMLTMQDPNDGGVYHKLTTLEFGGMVQPKDDKQQRYLVAKSSAAALDFAAVMSKANRVFLSFKNELPGLADSCLVAAKEAWKWNEKNPDVLYVQPEDVSTGTYGDHNIGDEKFWAANELYLSTKDTTYLKNIDFHTYFDAPFWSRVGALGYLSWYENDSLVSNGFEKEKFDKIGKSIIRNADEYYKTYETSAFNTSIDSFAWGSNSDTANLGIVLIHAYMASGQKKYLNAAEENLNYLLGANPLGMCFVTGFGINNPKNIHDRRSFSDNIEEPIPGLLVGGPTKQDRGDCGEERYNSDFPALSYLDLDCSYATNEIAINWNASLAFLLHSIEAIKAEENKN